MHPVHIRLVQFLTGSVRVRVSFSRFGKTEKKKTNGHHLQWNEEEQKKVSKENGIQGVSEELLVYYCFLVFRRIISLDLF